MSLSDLSDEELIARIKREELGSAAGKDLLQELFRRHWNLLENMAQLVAGKLPTVVDYDDIWQNVNEKVCLKIRKYDGRSPFSVWLRVLFEHAMIDTIRHESGMRKIFTVSMTPEIEEALQASVVPKSVLLAFAEKGINFEGIPEVQKSGDDWLIFSKKQTKTRKGTHSKYIARKSGAWLDIYRVSSTRGRSMTDQSQPQGGESASDFFSPTG